MYLKSIEVQGFKSFAQRINFEFHNGITGIVGPNGSGKSNVGDAVRWVLGEQSAKQLRGGNMQDIIFSGTENRRPLSFASVAITLDNGDHQLPTAYEEVTVTRRLYRSGESEYRINGSTCRLKDIQELFYDTGIGKEGYSIIGQGQIDKILSGKPEERRELFDEAAGIVKFKRRKQTAVKKLEEEKQNLVRVSDILSEITRQLAPLERQSETAKVYLDKKETLKLLEVNRFLQNSEETELALQKLEENRRQTGGELSQVQQSFEQTKQEYGQIERKLEELEGEIAQCVKASQEAALLKEQTKSSLELLKEQIRAGEQSGGQYRERNDGIAADLRERNRQLQECRREGEKLSEERRRLEQQKTEAEERLARTQELLAEYGQSIEDGKNEIIELLNGRATTKGKAQRFDAMLEQIQIRKAKLSSRALHIKSEEDELGEQIAEAEEACSAVAKQIRTLTEEKETLEAEVAALQRTIAEQSRQTEQRQSAYHREASRLESLKNLTERYDGYGMSIRKVMEQKERVPGICGVVADLIQVGKEYETAVETALGGSIQNIVTKEVQTAKQMIEYLKKNRHGRATFLPLDSIGHRGGFSQPEALDEPGVIGLASRLVTVQPEHQVLADYLLGRTLVVDHIDHAIALGRKYRHSLRMVTIEGESFSPGGSMTGGAFRNNQSLLGRRREIEELENSVRRLQTELSKLTESVGRCREEKNTRRDTIAAVMEKLQAQYLAQNTGRLNLEQLKEKKQELAEGTARVRQETLEIAQQQRELSESREQIRQELEHSQQEEAELLQFIENRQSELEQSRRQESGESGSLENLRIAYASLQQQEAFQRENGERLGREIASLQKEQRTLAASLQENERTIKERRTQIGALEERLAAEGQRELEGAKRLRDLQTEKESQSLAHKGFFEKREKLSQEIQLLDRECYRLDGRIEKLAEEKESRIAYLWEEYQITPVQAAEYRREELTGDGELQQQIRTVREEIRALGEVNVNAIEDYRELSERHTFLHAQHEDLVQAEATLLEIIRELDDGMRRQFSEKFREIQREFDKVFRELFGGGKGTLALTEDADLLEAGIRIISQPPGKKLQNMMQLSGGEKALTAIALLFAIQNLKPSPFCLLDEIEAALDDSNVTRFADYLQKLTKNTQFIIITHRRGTMRAADRLYGITMQEKGVSTLVSVDLVEKDLTK